MTRRIRQVRREFWSDSVTGRWPDHLRLFYVGLWCEADDDGYFDWDVAAIAADLYRYQTIASRERAVAARLADLVVAGRVRALECGRHGVIPTLPEHQVIAGRKNYEVRDQHRRDCYATVAMADRGRPGPPMADGMERNGEERNGEVSSSRARTTAREDGGRSEFAASMARMGFDPTRIGRPLTPPPRDGNTTPSDDPSQPEEAR